MTTALPILYSFRRCPYAIRARLGLMVAQQQVVYREVLLRDKPAALRIASPKATVPVLVLSDGRVVDESLDILYWALQKNDPQQWLHSDTETTKQWIDENDTSFKGHLDRYKYADRFPEKTQTEYRQQGEVFLQKLEVQLAVHNFLLGDQMGLVDAAIFPFIRQFAFVDKAWFDQSPYPCLQRWLEGWLSSDMFLSVMKKRAFWQDGDEPVMLLDAS